MLFSSITFIFLFLPLTLSVYYILFKSRTLQNIWLLIASLFFYAWGEPRNVFLMLASIFFNWLMGLLVSGSRSRKRKILLVFSCIFNISVLFVFKYLGFAINTINMFAEKDIIQDPQITLPIGISFYTFQAMSYVIDVYRKNIKAEKNPFYVGLYISFFPQLIAGPIVKYSTIAEQIRHRRSSFKKISVGCTRFVMGLAKKVLIANSLAECADQVFSWSSMGNDVFHMPISLAWIGSIAYTLQIYFDFSGYSDMAIALSLMFGFKLEENFDYPYFSKSINEFWRRWHISLTAWFREYVYIPLGGNRGENKDNMIRNMFIVWLLTGIWHGASWNFLFWGIWHFLFQLSERFFEYDKKDINPLFMRLYTLLVVNLGWVMFRAKDLYQTGVYLKNMFGLNRNALYNETALFVFKEYWMYLLIGAIFSTPIIPRISQNIFEGKSGHKGTFAQIIYPLSTMMIFILCLSFLVSGGYNPFIYFDF